ncbi:MAG: hypothetical protein PG981_001486 [Wolbachia endosymbiont of Ctenocephalides orientis wCori]|nr:MAG: hypothetical protein PG981_001486 [Wolbachia endosymbiont of Ctenocephalides orientis wCori]
MSIYMRFENGKQVETKTLSEGEGWYELPKNFDLQKMYRLTEGGEIVERSKEDIERDLLHNSKLCALNCLNMYFDRYANRYAGYSHAKAKSYEMQAKIAENILASGPNEKDTKIIEPLAKVRGISVIEMARLIQEKAKKAIIGIAKCEEMEDIAKKKIMEAQTQEELQNFLNSLEKEIEKVLKEQND